MPLSILWSSQRKSVDIIFPVSDSSDRCPSTSMAIHSIGALKVFVQVCSLRHTGHIVDTIASHLDNNQHNRISLEFNPNAW